ncbi:bis(5'-nucleosyl)-tetraphosphatase [Idiomarina tyrosinivorans]|uniref:bis(5'-nucleosyl)-tetraphosphatase (symmetrical) n=1 Tax=Idiomarina tyrosinivorans TaxID=1445662 RepID=A0A432ZS10_9GAMM|nr:symmetrical bis(5'-nucleosyl)-tetraphosphatase [Idiomarina tyrosinivorans]RUO80687.1 bis(5'-nucleosyl)-tetraphosphatase [Idiomarina tyrosinivorans]
MAVYYVGDIQGCIAELDALLTRVGFNPNLDQLRCVGDLVARGPHSDEVVKRFQQLGDAALWVLGNHDLNLLAILAGEREPNPADRLQPLIEQRHALNLDEWIRQQPLVHYDSRRNILMSHAGLYPRWSITDALNYADEVHDRLRNDSDNKLLHNMYGNKPDNWCSSLSGFDRYRFIVNAFTRMRFCFADGRLDFSHKGPPGEVADSRLAPWFNNRSASETRIVFGHWAALMGHTGRDDIIGLDTGCVWGESMTLWNADSGEVIQQPALT